MSEHDDLDAAIQKSLDGDSDALASLFEAYLPRLRRMVVLRMDARVRARIDASDVVQEAFVDVARQISNYKEQAASLPFFMWMRMVAGSRLVQLHRKHLGTHRRAVSREVSAGYNEMPVASSVFLATELAGNSLRWTVASGKRTLRPSYN